MAARRAVFDPTDPVQMTPKQRLAEIAAILAAGVLRMRAKRRVASMSPIPPESGETRLELSRETSPDGQRG